MIEVKNLSFSFAPAGKKILNEISFDIEQGKCVAILGNNGAGKSTLLKCMNRIHRVSQGDILVNGESIFRMKRREMAKRIAYVPQHSEPTHTMVFDTVLLGRKPYIQWDVTEKDRNIVSDVLERFELSRMAARHLDELSGGELQKVILARAMAQQPDYLLLDEPTSNLDPYNQHEMLRMVAEIAHVQKIGVVLVIHDLNLALRYCDQFLFVKDAGIYAYGDKRVVTSEAIQVVYGMSADIIEYKGRTMVVPD